MRNGLYLDVHEKPSNKIQWLGLSLQHVLAMFGATILVPLLTGLDPAVALFASGVGTLIYIVCTGAKVPVYLGSSFAYIGAIKIATDSTGVESAFVGLMAVGVIYVLLSLLISVVGTGWLRVIMPDVVMGSMIIIIGLSLAYLAIQDSGLLTNISDDPNAPIWVATSLRESWKVLAVAFVTLLTIVITATKAEGVFKMIPIMMGIAVGYLLALAFGMVDFTPFDEVTNVVQAPNFNFVGSYELNFAAIATFAPLALVTIAEHIGDHKVLGEVTSRDFTRDPGLHRTILGDGLATFTSACFGGPANTTYGENTGVVAMTKVASVYVTAGAAVIAVMISFFPAVPAFLTTIPSPVIGGVSIMLFGLIASNGFKVLQRVDFNNFKNVIIASVMVIVGIGGAQIKITESTTLSGMALAVVFGVLLVLMFRLLDRILPDEWLLDGDEDMKIKRTSTDSAYMAEREKELKSHRKESGYKQRKLIVRPFKGNQDSKWAKKNIKKNKKSRDNRHRPKKAKGDNFKL